jgi:hypothetical protein
MTGMDRPVKRRTVTPYRVTVTGVYPDPQGRKLVVELTGDGHGDLIRIRESGRRKWVELDVAELYRKALIAESRRHKAQRAKKRST